MSGILLGRTAALLQRAGISHALIGAGAMASHGVSRSTLDRDLLAVDTACLDRKLWEEMTAQAVEVEVLRGDLADPLAGVVRLVAPAERPVDVVVGKFRWQRQILERATNLTIDGVELPVVRAADLILLKLYAGGPQDAWDIRQLLLGDPGALAAEVEARLPHLPLECSRLWRQVRADLSS